MIYANREMSRNHSLNSTEEHFNILPETISKIKRTFVATEADLCEGMFCTVSFVVTNSYLTEVFELLFGWLQVMILSHVLNR